MTKSVFIIVAVLIIVSFASASYPQPVGLWQFDDSGNLTLATIGQNLSSVGNHSAVAGIDAGDGAVLDPLSGYYACTHGILPASGYAYVNDWSLMLDVKIPAASMGSWVCFFQTHTANGNDGDCFISPSGTVGVGDTGYSSNTVTAETWYRLIISVSNSNFYRIYVDGILWLEGTPQSIDGRFSLDSQILFFADENGEDAAIHCSNVAMWGQALSGQEAFSLGGASATMASVSSAGLNLLANASAESGLANWTIVDGFDWQATNITGWHFPHTGQHYFTPGRTATAEISQTIDLTFIAEDIDNGYAIAVTEGYLGGYDTDRGRIIIEYRDTNDTLLSALDSGWITGPAAEDWAHVSLPDANGLAIPLGTRSASYRLLAERIDSPDCQVFFDDLVFEYSLAIPGGNRPSVSSISAPSTGVTGDDIEFVFSVDLADTEQIQSQVDWGDGVIQWSDVLSQTSDFTVQHAWTIPGEYGVRIRVRDANDRISEWSEPLNVTISGDAAGLFMSQPHLQNVTTDSMTISWETDRLVKPLVEWGPTTAYGNQISGLCLDAGFGVYICHVRIPGLDAQATYHYRAYNGSTMSADATFTTAPHDEIPFTFAVWGDSQQIVRRLSGDRTHPECSTAIFSDMASIADVAVSVGDVVDYNSYYWYETAFRPYVCDILGKQKPFFVAFGNHDEPETSLVHRAVQNSAMGSFSFNYGNAHFTCINYSQCNDGTLPSDGHISSLPLDWIEQDLSSDFAQNATWRFLFIHVPPFCERWFDGSSLMQTHLVPLMNQYNVQICFSGHTHEYERGLLDGTFYVITGVCSYLDIAESITEDWPFMTVGGAQDIAGLPDGGGLMHGWTEVQINGTELNLKMHGYNLDGTYFGVIDTVHFAQSDFTMDGTVNLADLVELSDVWLQSGESSSRDLADRRQKIINLNDLAEFAHYWQFQGSF